MILGKHFEFEASHQLPQAEQYGKCAKLHGHTYKLQVEIEGAVNADGWVTNFVTLKQLVNKHIIEVLDHAHINDIIPHITTVEHIIVWIWKELDRVITEQNEPYRLHALKLYETSTSYAVLTRQEVQYA